MSISVMITAFIVVIAMISKLTLALPTSTRQRCDCPTKNLKRSEPIDLSVITCQLPQNEGTSQKVLEQLAWKTRKESLLRSTTVEALEMFGSDGDNNDDSLGDVMAIGTKFFQQLPRIPDPVLSDVSATAQRKHVRQMQDSVQNATTLLRKFLRYVDQERPANHRYFPYKSDVSRQYYDSMEFALVHVYCPMSQFLGLTPSGDEDDTPRSNAEQQTPWEWHCLTKDHCRRMEKRMLRELIKLENQLTDNISRLQQNSSH